MLHRFALSLSVLCTAFLLSSTAVFGTGATGSIAFTMEGPDETPDIVGHWTLIRPGNERTEGDDKEFTFQELGSGSYSFLTTLPEGTSASIEILKNGVPVETLARPQVSISLDEGDSYVLKIKFTYTRSGTVSVTSTPTGIEFTLKGPNGTELRGETPAAYEGFPEGQYTAYFDTIPGCKEMPPKSDRLIKASRITLSIDVICENAKETEGGQQDQKMLEFVSVEIDGKIVVLEDVPTAAWFAPYVYNVAKADVISGYRDGGGNALGLFGPSDLVTIAQLSKIVHEGSSTDETKIRTEVQNVKAKGQWFEQYFISAEQRYWEVWRDRRIDPSRPAKRAEVLGTIMRAFAVRTVWPEGKIFSDVDPYDQFAGAIETAAVDGLIDSGGAFRPNDPINRAEIAKIISNAIDLYGESTDEIRGESR